MFYVSSYFWQIITLGNCKTKYYPEKIIVLSCKMDSFDIGETLIGNFWETLWSYQPTLRRVYLLFWSYLQSFGESTSQKSRRSWEFWSKSLNISKIYFSHMKMILRVWRKTKSMILSPTLLYFSNIKMISRVLRKT